MKKQKKTWDRGRKRLDGEIVNIALKLTRAQYDYLKATGNLSAEVRRLVDAARDGRQLNQIGGPRTDALVASSSVGARR